MWPFREKPDTRPATAAAIAVAKSLRCEPQRWGISNSAGYLKHDTGIHVSTNGFIYVPDLDDEPDANGELVSVAVDDWVALQMAMPPKPVEKPDGEVSA